MHHLPDAIVHHNILALTDFVCVTSQVTQQWLEKRHSHVWKLCYSYVVLACPRNRLHAHTNKVTKC